MTRLTASKKKRILTLHNEGLSQRQIARKVDLAQSTVGGFLRRENNVLPSSQRVEDASQKSIRNSMKPSKNAPQIVISSELAEELADVELATAKRKRMTEERLIKEEELKDRLLDIKLRRVFDKGMQIGEPEPDYERQLSQGARENLRLLLSKNTNNPFLTQHVQELQEQQQQQQPSDFEKMLRFMDFFISSRPPDETVASPRPLPQTLPKREKSTRELITSILADLRSSNKTTKEMATSQRSTEMIRDIREAITDSIQVLAKPAFEGHREEVKAQRHQPAPPLMKGRLGPKPPKEAGRIF